MPLFCFLLAGGVFPASALCEGESELPESGVLAEIIVTARKVEENVLEVPMSVQVLPGDYLDDADRTRLYELQFAVPGLVVSNTGLFGAGFALRGVTNSVATHLNGVYLGDSNLAIARMFDVERIEVLKGPQGTLYGRNSTGGSLNVITRVPQDEWSANIEASYGTFETSRLQGYLNVPSETVDFRLALIGSQSDGYIRNSVDDRRFAEDDFWGLRGSLRIRAGENLRVDFAAQRVADDGASGELWAPNPAKLADPDDIRLATVTLENPYLVTKNDNASLSFEYDLGPVSLYSITGYASNEIRDLDDCAPVPSGCIRGVLPSAYQQWSQELRVASTGNDAIDWLLGAYYFDAGASEHFFFVRPLFDPRPINNAMSRSDEIAYALFGQTTWRLDEQWNISAGMRLSAEENRVSDRGTGTDDHAVPTSANTDAHHTSWRVDVAYTATDNLLAYAAVSTGFRSGGVTTTILPGGDFNRFDAEELVAWEIGLKAQWPGRLTVNGAAFLYDFTNMQIASIHDAPGRTFEEIENAGKARIVGIDAAGTLRISEHLTAATGFVWLPQREIVAFHSEISGDAYSGNDLSRAPEWTATAALDCEFAWSDRGSVSGRLEYAYRSHFFFTPENDPSAAQRGFGLLNLLLRFEPVAGKWYVFLSGRNLADEDYFNQVFIQSSPGYPDTWEAGFGYYF